MAESNYVTVEEMAALHGVAAFTIQRILQKDARLPEDQRRLPGAYKEGSFRRGVWKIPRAVAEAWQRDPRGRK